VQLPHLLASVLCGIIDVRGCDGIMEELCPEAIFLKVNKVQSAVWWEDEGFLVFEKYNQPGEVALWGCTPQLSLCVADVQWWHRKFNYMEFTNLLLRKSCWAKK